MGRTLDAMALTAGLLLVMASCGGGVDPADSTRSTPPATTTSARSTEPTTSLPAATAVSTTTTSIEVEPEYPILLPEEQHPGLLQASKEVPWEEIDQSWILFEYKAAFDIETDDWHQVPGVLYLQSANGDRYSVGQWQKRARIFDWSVETQQVLALYSPETDSNYLGEELWLVDLRTGYKGVLLDAEADRWLDSGFAGPNMDQVVVRVTSEGLTRLIVLNDAGLEVTVLSESVWSSEDYADPANTNITWTPAGGPEGHVVVADRNGLRVMSLSGEIVRRLETPGLGCQIARRVGAAVWVSCINPEYADGPCWGFWGADGHRELWSVWIDGSDVHPIYQPPMPVPDECDSYNAYYDGAPASEFDETVLLVTRGCCECGGGLELLDDSGVHRVDLGEIQVCSPVLIGADPGSGYLVLDWPTQKKGRFGVLLQISTEGTLAGLETPLLNQSGGVMGAWSSN